MALTNTFGPVTHPSLNPAEMILLKLSRRRTRPTLASTDSVSSVHDEDATLGSICVGVPTVILSRLRYEGGLGESP